VVCPVALAGWQACPAPPGAVVVDSCIRASHSKDRWLFAGTVTMGSDKPMLCIPYGDPDRSPGCLWMLIRTRNMPSSSFRPPPVALWVVAVVKCQNVGDAGLSWERGVCGNWEMRRQWRSPMSEPALCQVRQCEPQVAGVWSAKAVQGTWRGQHGQPTFSFRKRNCKSVGNRMQISSN
jgi:hypothetical protein